MIPSRVMILSFPVELSLTRTMVWFAPALIEVSVSVMVWQLASSAPVSRAIRLSV